MALNTLLAKLLTFLRSHQVSLVNGILSLLTIAGGEIFSETAFKCPCKSSEAYYYGLNFIISPAIVLGIIGLLVNNLMWRFCHGCGYRSANYGLKSGCYVFTAIIGQASLVPCAWIFYALMDGEYYTCAWSKDPCNKTSEENMSLVAESQMYSWCFLVVILTFAMIVISISRCCDTATYVHSRYVDAYNDAEIEQMESLIKEKAVNLAKVNAEHFLGKPNLKKEDWDVVAMAPAHVVVPANEEDQKKLTNLYYSPLHKLCAGVQIVEQRV